MRTLTMTRIIEDIDSVAIMGFNEAKDPCEYVRDHCREHYGTANRALVGAALQVFRAEVKVVNKSSGNRRSIGTEALY